MSRRLKRTVVTVVGAALIGVPMAGAAGVCGERGYTWSVVAVSGTTPDGYTWSYPDPDDRTIHNDGWEIG